MSQIAFWLSLTVGALISLLFLTVIAKIWTGAIKLDGLLNDEEGKPSLARFQFLVFTAVIGLGLLIIIISATPPAFPVVDKTILILLGLSASGFLASKGLDIYRQRLRRRLE